MLRQSRHIQTTMADLGHQTIQLWTPHSCPNLYTKSCPHHRQKAYGIDQTVRDLTKHGCEPQLTDLRETINAHLA